MDHQQRISDELQEQAGALARSVASNELHMGRLLRTVDGSHQMTAGARYVHKDSAGRHLGRKRPP